MRVAVLSAAGVLRALCGVAGGSSKASLSAHFARWGNLAEVNAVCFFCICICIQLIVLADDLVERFVSGDCYLAIWHAGMFRVDVSSMITNLHLDI
jgi:hypothetical protein